MNACTSPRDWRATGPVAAALLTAVFYAIASWNHGFIYDDHRFIGQTPPVHSLADAARIFTEPHPGGLPYYRPLTRLTLQLQKAWTGDTPRPFHIFNAILAGAVCLAAYTLLRHPAFRIPRSTALPASLLFILHPVASDCIFPADSGRETLLPALLILLAARAWLSPRFWPTLAALTAFALALCAKEQALMLPLIFLALDLLPRPMLNVERWMLNVSALPRCLPLLRYLPLLLLCLAYLWLRHHLYGGTDAHLTLQQSPFAPLLSLLYGLQSAIVPRAVLLYEPPFAVWFSPWRLSAALLVIAAWGACLWRCPAPDRRLACFWAFWFILFQLPTAQILRQEAAYAERYVFVSLLGVVALLAASRSTPPPQVGRGVPPARNAVAPRLRARPSRFPLRPALMWIAALAAALTTLHRAPFYRSDDAFYLQWTRTNPAAPVAHMGLGRTAALAGRGDDAITRYRQALRLKPDYAAAHNNLGRALESRGDHAAAIAAYRAALRTDPDFVDAQLNLAAALAETGRLDEALTLCRQALQLQPDSPAAYNNLGGVLMRMNQRPRAMRALERSTALDPAQFEAHLNLAVLNAQAGRREAALSHIATARRLRPNDPACAQAAAAVDHLLPP